MKKDTAPHRRRMKGGDAEEWVSSPRLSEPIGFVYAPQAGEQPCKNGSCSKKISWRPSSCTPTPSHKEILQSLPLFAPQRNRSNSRWARAGSSESESWFSACARRFSFHLPPTRSLFLNAARVSAGTGTVGAQRVGGCRPCRESGFTRPVLLESRRSSRGPCRSRPQYPRSSLLQR